MNLAEGGRAFPRLAVTGCIKKGTQGQTEAARLTAFFSSAILVPEVTTVLMKVFSGATARNLLCSAQKAFWPVEDGSFISMAITSARAAVFESSR